MNRQNQPFTLHQKLHLGSAWSFLACSLVTLLAGVALHCTTLEARAQSDNFDGNTLSDNWGKYFFFPQDISIVPHGSGKALRIQASPLPGAAPAAAAISQTNIYNDFYIALDLVNWAVIDQAAVLLGHWTLGGDDGLSQGTGMILNYDVAQAGDHSGDRRGGQLQINTIAPGFNAGTVAAADITLEPGRSYRLVFQAQGDSYTGSVYDLNDLTTPLVTLHAENSTYPVGQAGFLSFSRDGTSGVTDVTIDNYYAGESDPNPTGGSALASPVPGTPVVVERTPSKRFANFFPASSGITFKAQTFSASQINASATKLFLNGVDVSSSLAPLPANGATATFTTAAGTLKPNTVYSARIELVDTTGALTSTNTFWFDTYAESYLRTGGAKSVEVEDYNYSNGQFQTDPIAISGLTADGGQVNGEGVGYFGAVGTPDVDYSKPGGSFHSQLSEYRNGDRVQITQGSTIIGSRDEAGDILELPLSATPIRIHDTQRTEYVTAEVLEYQVRATSPGDWFNYTREFAPTNYNVYLRCGSFNSTTIYLDQVLGDTTTTDQTTSRAGEFRVSNHLMRLNYKYEPLMFGSEPAVVSLGGTNTLRLTLGGTGHQDERVVSLDYLVFIPTASVPPSMVVQASTSVEGPYGIASNATLDATAKTITIPVSGNAGFYRLIGPTALTIRSIVVKDGQAVLSYQ